MPWRDLYDKSLSHSHPSNCPDRRHRRLAAGGGEKYVELLEPDRQHRNGWCVRPGRPWGQHHVRWRQLLLYVLLFLVAKSMLAAPIPLRRHRPRSPSARVSGQSHRSRAIEPSERTPVSLKESKAVVADYLEQHPYPGVDRRLQPATHRGVDVQQHNGRPGTRSGRPRPLESGCSWIHR
jgi:hypothetical protein